MPAKVIFSQYYDDATALPSGTFTTQPSKGQLLIKLSGNAKSNQINQLTKLTMNITAPSGPLQQVKIGPIGVFSNESSSRKTLVTGQFLVDYKIATATTASFTLTMEGGDGYTNMHHNPMVNMNQSMIDYFKNRINTYYTPDKIPGTFPNEHVMNALKQQDILTVQMLSAPHQPPAELPSFDCAITITHFTPDQSG